MAASGLATDMMEEKAAINNVVDPDRYVVKKSLWVSKSSNIVAKDREYIPIIEHYFYLQNLLFWPPINP